MSAYQNVTPMKNVKTTIANRVITFEFLNSESTYTLHSFRYYRNRKALVAIFSHKHTKVARTQSYRNSITFEVLNINGQLEEANIMMLYTT